MKETASPNLKRFYQNKLKQCTIGEKYEPLTFESHVFNQLMMFYKTSNLTVSQLDAVLCNVLTNCQNTSEVLLLSTASEKFKYLITKCCTNKGIDLEKENSKDLLAQLSNPDDLYNLIDSFTNGTVYHMFKYPKLEFDDVLLYMNNPSFNLKLTNEYLAKTIGFCLSKDNLWSYAEELCVIALKSYPDDENLLGYAIQTALLYGNPDVASEYVKTADKLSEISDTFLLKSLMNYYSSMLLIYSNRKYGSSKKKLLQYADLYINRQPYDEKPLFSIAQDFLAHTKIRDAIHFLEHVIHISNGCPGCCCMLIKILLSSGKTSLYIAKQVIDIAQKGLSIPFDIGLTNMAYLYHKSADMKLYLYRQNQIPSNYNITPNTIYNDYKNAYLSYKLSGYTIDTKDKPIRRRQLREIKIACLDLKIRNPEFSFIDPADFQ